MAEVVVCGAGIAGISTAFHLTRAGVNNVVIADPRPALSLTSDKSTECYRNWWPNEPMIRLMGRSVELLDRYARESGNVFGLNRRGYLYVTGNRAILAEMSAQAATAAAAGAGELRIHDRSSAGYHPADPEHLTDAPSGADLFPAGNLLRKHFPYLSPAVVGGLHVRTAGWLSAQQLGTWMLEQTMAAGATLLRTAVTAVTVEHNRIRSVTFSDGSTVRPRAFVNAAGPFLADVGRMAGVDLPVHSEVHTKTAFRDHRGVFPREAPLIIWNDPQQIAWAPDEIELLRSAGRTDLMAKMPAGCHARPEGGRDSPWVLGLWEYHADVRQPEWPLPSDALYTETVMRGLMTMVPGLGEYQDRLPEAVVDGGYYTKTVENRPLACQVGPTGSYVCGALSGFGIMAACAVGELVATAVTGGAMPSYAPAFDLRRYDDSLYVAGLAAMTDSGQL